MASKRRTTKAKRPSKAKPKGRAIKAKRKAKIKRKAPAPHQVLIVTLSENGTPRRRAEISWPAHRHFTLKCLANHRDCGRWVIPVGWIIRIQNKE